MDAVTLTNVSKTFTTADGETLRAVDDLSISIEKGEIFCIVGPDGAGKTTTVRMMCGVLPPSAGTISIMGIDIRTHRDEAKQHIGYLSQKFTLYGDLTVDENIDFFAEIHREKNFGARKQDLLDMTRLGPFRDRLAINLSGGMKQKLALACTLIHEPDVIFLDEPTTGVDPVSRRDFWRILSTLLKQGITIVVTTPYLDEAERSSRVALMNAGRVVQCDTPTAVRNSLQFDVYEVTAKDVRELGERLRKRMDRRRVQIFGDRLHVLFPRTEGGTDVPQELAELDATQVHRIPPSLEDVFIQQTQQSEA